MDKLKKEKDSEREARQSKPEKDEMLEAEVGVTPTEGEPRQGASKLEKARQGILPWIPEGTQLY